jgi:hypothetical protein
MHGVLLGTEERKPTSRQIVEGMNSYNQQLEDYRKASKVYIGKHVQLEFTGLQFNHEYAVYISGENTRPEYPDVSYDVY